MKNKIMDREYWLSLFCIIAYYCRGIPNALNENNTIYALEQINQYDNSIYADNIAVAHSGGGVYLHDFSQILLLDWE